MADEALLKEHYKDLVTKPFFPSLLKYMTSGPVVPMVWEGNGVVAAGRTILGATKPAESAPGTVRGASPLAVTLSTLRLTSGRSHFQPPPATTTLSLLPTHILGACPSGGPRPRPARASAARACARLGQSKVDHRPPFRTTPPPPPP